MGWDVEKVHAVVAGSTFRSQNVKNTRSTFRTDHFWRFRCRSVWQAQGIVHLVKSEQNVRVLWHFKKTMAGVGHLKKICEDAFSAAGAVQETCSSELLEGPGADFLRGVAFWSIRSSVLRRWFCVTGAALRMTWHTFSWQAQYFRQVECKNCKTHWYEGVSSALNFLFLKEVSQNCFVFDVVKFKKWRSLAELFRFWCCQVQKLRKSRRIAAFLMLSSSKTEEVSQNSFVFTLADRQIDRETNTTATTTTITSTTTLHYHYYYY